MDTQSYAALASVTQYWYLILIALIFLSLVLVSVSEYRQKKKIRKEVGRFVGYLEQKGSQDRIGLTEENILGSGSRCDIIIDSPYVRKTHAVIYYRDGMLILRPVSGDTKINGRRAIREHEIFTGDSIETGDVSFKVYKKEATDNEN